METAETAAPLSLVSNSESESAANVESAAEDAAAINAEHIICNSPSIVNVTTLLSCNMIEEAAQLTPAPRGDDATDTSTKGTSATTGTTRTGSARQEAANGQASLSFVDRVDTATSSTTTTQRRAVSLDHGTNFPPSGDDDEDAENEVENKVLSNVHRSDHVASKTTTTTELGNSSSRLDVSINDTDKDSSAYVEALLSAIATFPASDFDTAAHVNIESNLGAVYRLPNGEVVTSKNTMQSYSTAAVNSSSSNRRNSDNGSVHFVRGVSVPPLSANGTAPILVNVVHATQDHNGAVSSSPPLLATVVSSLNESTDRRNRFKKVRIWTVGLFAILLIAVTLFFVFYGTGVVLEGSGTNESATSPTENIDSSVSAPTANASQSRATAVTDYVNSIRLSTKNLTIPTTFRYQYESGEQAALDWLVNYDPLTLWPDTDMNRFRLRQRYALLTLLLQFLDFDATSFNESECEWIYETSCDSKSTELSTQGADVVTEISIVGGETIPGSTLSPDLGHLSNLVTFRIERAQIAGSLSSTLGMAWTSLATFDVSENGLTGTLPSTLGMTWTNLVSFSVWDNALTRSLPTSLGTAWTNLTWFVVVGNALTGLAPSLGAAWTNLTTFAVYDNVMTGRLPPMLGETWTGLTTFDVSSNGFTGRIPPSLGMTWTNLAVFDVKDNALSGTLPSSLGAAWTNLTYFDVNDNALTGSIPALMGATWNNLEYFYMSGNGMTGSLSSSLGSTAIVAQ